ncbi:hypothetical protein QTP88_007682 [Uroleucon formosanum]
MLSADIEYNFQTPELLTLIELENQNHLFDIYLWTLLRCDVILYYDYILATTTVHYKRTKLKSKRAKAFILIFHTSQTERIIVSSKTLTCESVVPCLRRARFGADSIQLQQRTCEYVLSLRAIYFLSKNFLERSAVAVKCEI